MKIPAEFAPQSWEMPPGFRVVEESASVVTREFDGEKLDWLVALVTWPPEDDSALYWVRPMDARFDAGFVICIGNGSDYLSMAFDIDTEPFVLRASLTTVWKNNQLSRRFILNKNGELRKGGEEAHEILILSPDGMAAWGAFEQGESEDDYKRNTAFKWSSPFTNIEFLRLSAMRIWEKSLNLLTDADNEAAFARCFAQLNKRERSRLVFDETRGTEANIKSLVRARVHLHNSAEYSIPDGERKINNLYIRVDMDKPGFYWDHHFRSRSKQTDELIEDIEHLVNCFRPLKSELLKISCVKAWLQLTHHFVIELSHFTAHEQIESHLIWREWKESFENQKF